MTDPQAGAAAPKNFELLSNDDKQKIILKLKEVPQQQVEKFIYQNKRQEWALTAEATKWIVREMADKGEVIRIDGHPKVERDLVDPEWMTCSVLGNRVKVDREGKSEMVLDSNIGSARTWIKQKIGKDDNAKIIPDEFWYTKVVSKATRNLQQSMIPNDFKKAIITRLLEIKNGKPGGTTTQQRQTQGPPAGQGAPGGGAAQGQGSPKPGGAPGSQQPAGAGAPGGPPAGAGAPGGQAKPPGQAPPNQGQANQGQQKPPQPGKPAGQQKPAASPSEMSLEAVQQGFRAVFMQFAGTEDKPTLQKILKALTGKTAVTDLEKGLMIELGPLLRRKIKGEVKFNGTALHETKTGEQLWPKPTPQEEPMPEPQHEEAPPAQDESIPLF